MKTRDLHLLLIRAANVVESREVTPDLVRELREAAEEYLPSKTAVEGLHEYRFKNNPEERRFAQHWRIITKGGDMLEWLLGPGNTKVRPSIRDRIVAATVIQWLGSDVGQAFLTGLGYKKREEKS